MRKTLIALAILGMATTPAVAQANNQAQAVPEVKQKMVTKQVCERVRDEGATGSRLSKPVKVCRIVEVPAEENSAKTQPEGHRAHAN